MRFTLHAAGKSDVGLVRQNNEDNFGFDTRRGIFVVCDGMGGEAAGERASKIAVDTVLEYFCQPRKERHHQLLGRTFEGVSARANALGRALQLANQMILQEAAQNRSQAGMGSTIVAVAIEGNYFSIANVGDSRIYLIRAGSIQQLTDDHSLVMEQVRRGLLPAEQAEQFSMKNVILRALGSDESVEPDLVDHELLANDLLLLCSDGMTRQVNDDTILAIVSSAKNLSQICDDLIQAAKDAASDDNITCLMVKALEPSWRDRLIGRAHQSQKSL